MPWYFHSRDGEAEVRKIVYVAAVVDVAANAPPNSGLRHFSDGEEFIE